MLFLISFILRIFFAPIAACLYIAAMWSEGATAMLISLVVGLDVYKNPEDSEN